eukprot:1307308-Amphidinium_carterae.2
MVLVVAGPYFAPYLRDSYQDVLKMLTQDNMQDSGRLQWYSCQAEALVPSLCKVWRALPPCEAHHRDLGVDTQWAYWRNPVQ